MQLEIRKKELQLGLDNPQQVIRIGKALSSELRIEILKQLIERAMSISEIAELFYLPVSSASMHIKVLKEAELISVLPKPGLRGTKKLCGIKSSLILVDLFSEKKSGNKRKIITESMPVGNYSDCKVHPPCGIASEVSYLAFEDSPYGFYSTQRNAASLLWLSKGYLEYKFSNRLLMEGEVYSVELSFEICSEAPGYNNDWPSDITIYINREKITTFLCQGDYGDHRGALNPEWWSNSMTQYGELRYLLITDSGCYLDMKKISTHTIKSLKMDEGYFFEMRIGVDEDAVHSGGMNLFGKYFGDHNQDINMKVTYR